MFGRRRTPSARPYLLYVQYWPHFSIGKSISFVVPSPSQVLSFWRRYPNHMHSYQVSMVDVPQSPNASAARGPLLFCWSVPQLWSETVADRRRLIYDSDKIWWPYVKRGRMWHKFPEICLTVEGKPEKTSSKKWTRPGIAPGPSAWEVKTLHLHHSSGLRGPWQQRCDSLHCHEVWWDSVPPVSSFSPQSMRLRSLRQSEKATAGGPGITQEMNLSAL